MGIQKNLSELFVNAKHVTLQCTCTCIFIIKYILRVIFQLFHIFKILNLEKTNIQFQDYQASMTFVHCVQFVKIIKGLVTFVKIFKYC